MLLMLFCNVVFLKIGITKKNVNADHILTDLNVWQFRETLIGKTFNCETTPMAFLYWGTLVVFGDWNSVSDFLRRLHGVSKPG